MMTLAADQRILVLMNRTSLVRASHERRDASSATLSVGTIAVRRGLLGCDIQNNHCTHHMKPIHFFGMMNSARIVPMLLFIIGKPGWRLGHALMLKILGS
jgi:hypothetical protein